MAQKVNIVLIDDIDQSEADETVSFGLDGRDYTIDLNSEHAAQLRDALALYVAHGEAVSGRKVTRGRAAAKPSGASDAGAIREWAKGKGYAVSERGRIPSEIRDAYAAAH